MTRGFLWGAGAAILLMLTGCAESAIEGERYKGNGYSLLVPDGWALKSDLDDSNSDISLSPAPKHEFRDSLALVKLEIDSISSDMDDASYLQSTIPYTSAELLSDYNLLEEEAVTINGLDGVRLRYRWPNEYIDEVVDGDVYILMRGNKAYILYLTAAEGQDREKWMPLMTEVARSFRIE